MISPAEIHPPGRIRLVLERITTAVSQRPWGTLAMVTLLCAISLGITVRFLGFKTSRSDLIAPSADFQQRWLRYVERFGEPSDVVVVIEAHDPQRVREVMDVIGDRLEDAPDLFSRVVYRIDPSSLKRKSMQFLTPTELEQVDAQLAMYGPVLDGHWDRAGLESYSSRLTAFLQTTAPQAAELSMDPRPGSIDLVLDQARRLSSSLDQFILTQGEQFESPWPVMLNRSLPEGGDPFAVRYQTTADGQMGFVLATPVSASQDFAGSSRPLALMRQLLDELTPQFPDVGMGMTGIPVLESDEMQRSQQDMSLASLISICGVGIIMFIGFRGFRHPLLAMLMLLVGIAWTMGYTTIAVGHLNILSVSFAAILIGLGIDFAVIYLSRYVELRHHGAPLTTALINASDSVGTGILTASITTSLAFLCSTFTNFLGIVELGVIAGGGIMLCATSTLIVLPALVTVADRGLEPKRMAIPFQGKLLRHWTQRYPGAIVALSVLLIAIIGSQGFEWRDGKVWSRVEYDANLLNLQARGLKSIELQQRLFDKADGSLLYAISLTDSAEQARRLHEQYLELPTVKRVEDLASLMPRYPASETSLLVQSIHSRLANLSTLPREFPQLDPLAIGQSMERLYLAVRSRTEPGAVESAASLDRFLTSLEQLDLPRQMELLAGFQYRMLASLHMQFQALAEMSTVEPVSPRDFPESLRARFVSPQGDWLLRVYPAEEIWDEKPLARFVADVRTVDPEVTGTPLQNFEASRQIRQSYLNAALYAFAVVWIVLLIDALDLGPTIVSLGAPLAVVAFSITTVHGPQESIDPAILVLIYVGIAVLTASIFDFPSVRNTMFTLLPPLAGLFLMFGFLALLDVDLNPANLIVLPLILGIGVDYGVHVVHDYRMQVNAYRTTPSTMNAVMISSLTSMLGFGSMLVSAHQGLKSLAIVLLVGVASCVFVSLVLLPAFLTLVTRDQPAPRKPPVRQPAQGPAGASQMTGNPTESRLPTLPGKLAGRASETSFDSN